MPQLTIDMIKLHYDYTSCPLTVRIVADKLCLDHTFIPEASRKYPMNIGDFILLEREPFIDHVFINIAEGEAWYFDEYNDYERGEIAGWFDVIHFIPIQEPSGKEKTEYSKPVNELLAERNSEKTKGDTHVDTSD